MHITKNPRSYQKSIVLSLAEEFVTNPEWPVTSVIVTAQGQTGKSNMAETMKAIFGDDAEGSITINEKKIGIADIYTKAAAFDLAHEKELFACIYDGRHRAGAKWLAEEFFGVSIEPEIAEVSLAKAEELSLTTGFTNDLVAKLLTTEKLAFAVEMVRSKKWQKQADVRGSRQMKQTLWHRANAVIVQGVPMEQAVLLDKKQAREVSLGTIKVEDALAARKNKVKCLPGTKIAEVLQMCTTCDPLGNDVVTKVLDAINTNAETTLKTLIAAHFRAVKAAEAAKVEAESPKAKAKK